MDGYVPFLVALIGLWDTALLLCGIVAARETVDWVAPATRTRRPPRPRPRRSSGARRAGDPAPAAP